MKKSLTVKAAWITFLGVIIAAVIAGLFHLFNNSKSQNLVNAGTNNSSPVVMAGQGSTVTIQMGIPNGHTNRETQAANTVNWTKEVFRPNHDENVLVGHQKDGCGMVVFKLKQVPLFETVQLQFGTELAEPGTFGFIQNILVFRVVADSKYLMSLTYCIRYLPDPKSNTISSINISADRQLMIDTKYISPAIYLSREQ